MRLPPLSGLPVRVELRPSLGAHLAATFLPRRLILLDAGLLQRSGDLERILVHEIFHFSWVRLPNASRWSWERLLAVELDEAAPGELGWSAEWRKARLRVSDRRRRTPAWRRYACESFCDTAAWLFAGIGAHPEFTLAPGGRRVRRQWFRQHILSTAPISI